MRTDVQLRHARGEAASDILCGHCMMARFAQLARNRTEHAVIVCALTKMAYVLRDCMHANGMKIKFDSSQRILGHTLLHLAACQNVAPHIRAQGHQRETLPGVAIAWKARRLTLSQQRLVAGKLARVPRSWLQPASIWQLQRRRRVAGLMSVYACAARSQIQHVPRSFA